MIERLVVRDFVLVDHLELDFRQGFNVLSGETGAGKSILVGALSMLFGAKGDTDLVREGSDEALVVGTFVVDESPEAAAWLEAREVHPEDGQVIVRRSLKTSGRGPISIQGVPVTRKDLGEFASIMIDMHSQHEHQSLFTDANHRKLIDRYAGHEETVRQFGKDFASLSEARQKLESMKSRAQDRDRELEMLRFALEEIESAGLVPGEVDSLEQEREGLVHYEKLVDHLKAFESATEGEELDLSRRLRQAASELTAAARLDSRLSALAERLDSVYYETEDVLREVTTYFEQLAYDPDRLDEIESRLALVRRLERKYRSGDQDDPIGAILAYEEESRDRLKELENFDENRTHLEAEVQRRERDLRERAFALHEAREKAAGELKAEIEPVLHQLAMPHARFDVQVEARTSDSGRLVVGSHGADAVRFMFGPNPGEPVRGLDAIASGGELSRVMLAIKSVLADSDDVRSLVFDEIDTGIGGQVSVAMADHLRKLADGKQVICITHLATIAVRADNHIVVEKATSEDRTTIHTRAVQGTERENEIARMLSGDSAADVSVEHARALLAKYRSDAWAK